MLCDNKLDETTSHQVSQSPSVPSLTQLPSSEDYDFLIIADGSGWTDHIGGYGAIILSVTSPHITYEPAFGASTHTETGRAEFMAILNALHAIVDKCGYEHASQLELLKQNKPRVFILSDRMDLVGSLLGMYKRRTNLDLWAQFAWYTQYFAFTAAHITRDTFPLHKSADALASELRLVLKDFADTQTDVKNI